MTITNEQRENADWLLSTTRSVRKRLDLDRPVDPRVVLECIALAEQAPTGSNMQGWRWVVVTDPAQKAGLAECYRQGAERYRAALARSEAAISEQTERVRDSSTYLTEVIDQVPVLVVPCLQGRVTDVRYAPGFFGSIYPAVWSFNLALRARGLGTVLTTFHLAAEAEAGELLGIPDDVTQAGLLPVAYTKGTEFRPADRPPPQEITYWNHWGEHVPPSGTS